MNAILTKLKEEILNAIPAIIYFIIALNLIHYSGELARDPGDIQYFTYLTVTIVALIIGKMIVIVNCFSFINAFPQKPIIYNVVWKLVIYMIGINCLMILHIMIHTSLKEHSLLGGWQHLLFDMSLPIFWSTEMFLILAFLAYVIFSELVRVIGKEKMRQIFIG